MGMEMEMEDLPVEKVTISGPTLSSLLHHLSSSQGPTHGLLFGISSLSSPSLSDDDSPLPPSLSVALTSFSSSPSPSRHSPVGHFSSRRHSPLRPSLLDHSLSLSLSSSPPFLFLLLTSPLPQTLIHTHEYRVFQFRPSSMSYSPVPIEVVNIGPGFRGQYGSFSPTSGLPRMACEARVGSPMREDKKKEASLSEMKRAGKDLEAYVGSGYDVGSLSRLMGAEAVAYVGGVEELYEKMLSKLHSLASLVESSNARVLELENHNVKLRRKVAGIE